MKICKWFLIVLVSAGFVTSGRAQESGEFAGNWTIKIGERVFLVLTVAGGGAGQFRGALTRVEHFSTSGSGSFSNIKGVVIHEPIVKGTVKENCFNFTVQNPADHTDEDDYRLCLTGQERGTLKPDVAGVEPWPVVKEKGELSVSTDWDSVRVYYLNDSDVSNSEMEKIWGADQKDRQAGVGKIDWKVVNKADAARREATARLLAGGNLHTGEDFERAAFVFQHGGISDDYLLAHTLAIVAMARGRNNAILIASATMDRYFNSIDQPQIYGTQFWTMPNEPTTQEPFNRSLISDALRRYLGVPSLAAQEEQKKQYDVQRAKP